MCSDSQNMIAVILLMVLLRASAEMGVHIRSNYGQLVTSSTLQWVPGEDGTRPQNAVVGAHEIIEVVPIVDTTEDTHMEQQVKVPVYVCRARHNGVWISGQLRSDQRFCSISLLGVASTSNRYEVLENVDEGARLQWVPWDRFSRIPTGAVAGGETYVARRVVEDGEESNKDAGPGVLGFTHHLGKLDPKDGLGRITIINQNNEEQDFTDGEVLVEIEPVRYELTGLKFNLWRKRLMRRLVTLTNNTLRNGAATVAVNVDMALAYDSEYSLYWGQGKAILKGLPTTVRLANGTLVGEIKWGLPEVEERKDLFSVEYFLEPGTAVNVTLRGNHTESEVPYSGKLVAVYEDGSTKARDIEGSRREVAMLDVRPEFSAVYYIRNLTLVPTTTTTTSTTTTTTTTTMSTTTAMSVETPAVAETRRNKTPMGSNVKGENSSIQSDEASSLKKERGATPEGIGSNPGDRAGLGVALLLSIAITILHRIT
uniref:Protein unzipped n=1 Tax=Timema douglasi TaxID=61478 RepID=A0A7R8VX96_TIMDO|nr:unnamed protein product [Timema douglasi]